MQLLEQEIAPLGLGCWAIGGAFYDGEQALGYAGIDDLDSERTIHAALDSGIRLFDTAAVYGAGHSERLLGKALAGQADALVMTKFGTAFDERSKQVLGDEYDAAGIEKSIDASLARLRRDRIDILLLHLNSLSIELATPVFEALEQARVAGKIRAYGWSTDFPDRVAAMAGRPGFVGVEHAMNLFIDVPSIRHVIDELDLAAFIRSPLAMGLLCGTYDSRSVLPADDVRATNSSRREYFRDAKPAQKLLDRLDVVRELLRTGGRSLAQGALGWLMAKSARNIPLPGARNERQVLDNARAIDFGPLPAAVMREIEALIDREAEGEPRAR